MAGVDVHQRKRQRNVAPFDVKSLARQRQQHNGILAAGKKQGGVAAFGDDFTNDVDGFGFQPVQMAVLQSGVLHGVCFLRVGCRRAVMGHVKNDGWPKRALDSWFYGVGYLCRPHSLLSRCSHHQRPDRMSCPALTGMVHGSQPMLG